MTTEELISISADHLPEQTDNELAAISPSAAGQPMTAKRHRLTRADEKAILDSYERGMPKPEIMQTFKISQTQLTRILSEGFETGQIQPKAPRYYLLPNNKQYQEFFKLLGCEPAPFLKCQKEGDELRLTPYFPEVDG